MASPVAMASDSALRDVDGVRFDEFLNDLFDDELGTAYDAPLPASAYDAASFAARGTSPSPSVKSSQMSSPRSEPPVEELDLLDDDGHHRVEVGVL